VLLQPAKWLSLRASRTEGFKAPKLYDLLAPNYSTTTTITASRAVHDSLRNNEPVVGTYALTTGGQPHLQPETSVSRNVGAVVDLPWIKGLSFSADYWDLDFTQRVGGPSYQVLIDYFPDRVMRGPSINGQPGVITGFDTSQINLAGVKTQGMDYSLLYQRHFGFGNIAASAALSDPSTQFTKATPASKPTDTYGHEPKRFTGSLFWSDATWSVGTAVNYQAGYPPYGPASPQYAKRPYIEWNPQVTYTFHARSDSWASRLLADTKLSVTVVNVFNQGPEESDLAYGNYVMDPRLRRFILTFNKKL
jgi:iron complex outermembrane receptor protein